MMLSTFSRSVARTAYPQVLGALGARFTTSIGDTLGKKERVEEDRFMRAQEQEQLAKIRGDTMQAAEAAAAASEETQFQDHVLPVMEEVKGLLAPGDSLSQKSLEKLARWKLGL